jgi:hypothetical protein
LRIFIKYGFIFLSAGFGICGLFALVYLNIKDKKAFSLLLVDIGALGSFLSGLGTILAALVAAIGVNNWIKQLKYGKHLDIIWTSKVAIRKVHTSEMDWYISNYSYLQKPTDEKKEDLDIKLKKLEFDFNELRCECDQLDQIVLRSQFLWANYASKFEATWREIMWHMEENELTSKDLPKLNSAFSNLYNELMTKLEKVESRYEK